MGHEPCKRSMHLVRPLLANDKKLLVGKQVEQRPDHPAILTGNAPARHPDTRATRPNEIFGTHG